MGAAAAEPPRAAGLVSSVLNDTLEFYRWTWSIRGNAPGRARRPAPPPQRRRRHRRPAPPARGRCRAQNGSVATATRRGRGVGTGSSRGARARPLDARGIAIRFNPPRDGRSRSCEVKGSPAARGPGAPLLRSRAVQRSLPGRPRSSGGPLVPSGAPAARDLRGSRELCDSIPRALQMVEFSDSSEEMAVTIAAGAFHFVLSASGVALLYSDFSALSFRIDTQHGRC